MKIVALCPLGVGATAAKSCPKWPGCECADFEKAKRRNVEAKWREFILGKNSNLFYFYKIRIEF